MHNHTYSDFLREWNRGTFEPQRMGQALSNYFSIQDTLLFYEPDNKKATDYFKLVYLSSDKVEYIPSSDQ